MSFSGPLSQADCSLLSSVVNCSLCLLRDLPSLLHFWSRGRSRPQALCVSFAPKQTKRSSEWRQHKRKRIATHRVTYFYSRNPVVRAGNLVPWLKTSSKLVVHSLTFSLTWKKMLLKCFQILQRIKLFQLFLTPVAGTVSDHEINIFIFFSEVSYGYIFSRRLFASTSGPQELPQPQDYSFLCH